MLAGREWFFEHFTTADAYFFWCMRRAQNFKIDVAAYRNNVAHFARMRGRSSVKKLEAFEAGVIAQFASEN